jgi:Fur family transcriptional regulator, ferric uptake regulator
MLVEMEPDQELELLYRTRDEMLAAGNPVAGRVSDLIARAVADREETERVRNARERSRSRTQAAEGRERPDADWMSTPEGEVWARQARSALRRAGHKRGAAREALIKLFAGEDCALSIPEVEERLEFRRPVARASIYRALEVLSDLDLLTRIDVGDGVARYERAHDHDGEHHHHHLICDTCGLLIPFDDDGLETAIEGLSARLRFETKGHEVTLRGTCEHCKNGFPG